MVGSIIMYRCIGFKSDLIVVGCFPAKLDGYVSLGIAANAAGSVGF